MQSTTAALAAMPVPWDVRPAPRPVSDSPIYDRLELEWRRQGRTVPRPTVPSGWERVDEDRFGRA
ncbi:hypothetical protein [Streptomyces sp. NPDC090022]|uniref:hypothetical protein n=1 Tax=Streptomyces sp. NPDC090022 TaxID=3365920 RepID=UPI0037F962A3